MSAYMEKERNRAKEHTYPGQFVKTKATLTVNSIQQWNAC